MDLLSPDFLLRAFLVFVRIGGILVAAPFFGHNSIPVRVRILVSLILAYALVGLVGGPLPANILHPIGLVAAVCMEALAGLAIGFAAQFIFWAIQFAGELLGFQMGLGLAKVFDPSEGTNSNPIGRLLVWTFLLVFLLFDGHHQVLLALVGSYQAVPIAGANLASIGPVLLDWTGAFITTAFRLASPFMITIFLVDAALGVFARVAPQVNLFALALPVKLLVGLGITYFVLQHFIPIVPGMIDQMVSNLDTIVRQLAL